MKVLGSFNFLLQKAYVVPPLNKTEVGSRCKFLFSRQQTFLLGPVFRVQIYVFLLHQKKALKESDFVPSV